MSETNELITDNNNSETTENNQDFNTETDEQNNDGNVNDGNTDKTDKTDKTDLNTEIYGAPEVYDYKDIKLPKGYEYDKDMLKEFDALNKETNLSQAQANKYMEFGLRLAQKSAGNVPEMIKQIQQAKVTQFQQALNTDKEIGGGDKNKMNAYLDIADKGYSAFANDEVKTALAEAGLNYHPAIIKMFHKIGELVGDDKIYPTKIPSGNSSDPADVLYGN